MAAAFEAFYLDPTPLNAVRLAIADHCATAGGFGSHQFIDALHCAEAVLAAAEKVYEHRNLLLTRAGAAGCRQTTSGQWVSDPASQAFKELGVALKAVRA